ncbi:MAG: CPBP family intramembrane glutamic endopeptidase [Terriglobales bacterium]|jgi:membrane protease YdiL (CAAX protease family)
MLTAARAGVWQGVVHSPTAWVFTFVLAVIFPTLDTLLYFRLNSKLGLYAWNILAEWSLVAWCVCIIRRNGLRLADLGEGIGSPLRILVVAGVLAVIVVVLGVVSKRQAKKANPEQLRKATSGFSRLLPLTSTDRAVWIPVSITAGVCEEFLYRGWLLRLFGAALGSVWIGLILSSIVFGFAHSYQGRKGIIGTGILGIVFGGVFVLSRSLLPGQLLHAFMDLRNGYAFGKIASRMEVTPGS